MSLRGSRLTNAGGGGGGGGGFADGDTALAGDGTVSDPAYAFESDPDTGWYLAAAGDLRAAIGGVDTLQLSTTTFALTLGGVTPIQADSGKIIVGDNVYLRLKNSASAPSFAGNSVQIYAADVAAKSELHAKNENGVVTQITGVPATIQSDPVLAFGTWRTPNAARPTWVLLTLSVTSSVGSAARIDVELDRGGGTTADDTHTLQSGLGIANTTKGQITLFVPAGGSYRIVNTTDPSTANAIDTHNEITV